MGQSWVQLLLNSGIPAVVRSGGPGFSLGGPPPFGSESYVLVPRARAPEAVGVLAPFAAPGVLELAEEYDESS